MASPDRLSVLLLPVKRLFEPWCVDIAEVVGDRHDLAIYDDGRPIAEQFKAVDVVIDHGGHVGTREMMDAAAGARLWQIMSIGYEHVDIDYVRSKGMKAAIVPGTTSAASLAQTAMMFMLMLAHRAPECRRNFDTGVWLQPAGEELEGKTLGVVGLGHSGRRLARLATALGMRVVATNRSPIDETVLMEIGVTRLHPFDQLDELIRESDFVSLHLAMTEDTRRTMDARRIGLMKRTARLINIARGGLIEEPALYAALQSGRIAGAGLDVFDTEPPETGHPVFQLPQVIVTPHIAAHTDGSSRKRALSIAENIDRVAAGLEPLHQVG